MKVKITNTSIIPVNTTIEIFHDKNKGAKQAEGSFSIHPKQRYIPANETKDAEITFRPVTLGNAFAVVYISCMGSEKYKVNLSGSGGDSLEILEDKIDFGPTEVGLDSFFTKVIHIHNRDRYQKTPIRISWTAKEIDIDVEKTRILEPNEKLEVSVIFTPERSGHWTDTMTVSAANCNPIDINLVSFVGPFLALLSSPEIHLSSTMPGKKSAVSIPLVNYLDTQIEANIFFPPDTPFSFAINPLENNSSDNFDMTMVVFNDNEASGLTLSLGGGLTVEVTISFESPVSGIFRAPFTICLLKPYSIEYPAYEINALCFDDDFYFDKPVTELQKIVESPAKVDIKTKLGFADMEKMDKVSKAVYTDYMKIEPEIVFLCTSRDGKTSGACKLINLTDSRRHYKLILSKPFLLSCAMEGYLDAEDTLILTLSMSGSKSSSKMYYGMLTVVDVDENVVHSVEIKGVNGHVINLDLPSKGNSVLFPRVAPRKKLEKKVYLENMSSYPVPWDIRPCSTKAAKTGVPFKLSSSTGELRPFQKQVITVGFESAVKGEYLGEYVLSYRHPLLESDEWFTHCEFKCEAVVGSAELVLFPKSIDFGNVFVGHTAKQYLNVTNPSSQEAELTIIIPKKFETSAKELLIPANSQHRIDLFFCPLGISPVAGFISILHSEETFNIPIAGKGGTIDVHTEKFGPLPYGNSLGCPIASKMPVGCDKGVVATNNSVYFEEVITNRGSSKFSIRCISSSNVEVMTWSLGAHTDLNVGIHDAEEVDWDELQYQKHEKLKLQLSQKKASLDITPKERARRASLMIESGFNQEEMSQLTEITEEDLEYLTLVDYPIDINPYQNLVITLKFKSEKKVGL